MYPLPSKSRKPFAEKGGSTRGAAPIWDNSSSEEPALLPRETGRVRFWRHEPREGLPLPPPEAEGLPDQAASSSLPMTLDASTGSSGWIEGPFRTFPEVSKREPWHGQSQLFSALFQCTWQPRWGQMAEQA